MVSNVTKPTLTVFKPSAETKNGTAIVVCPGGGFMALSIESEGYEVAKYLAAKGVTAFVLKYRLAHTGDDATTEFTTLYADHAKFMEMRDKVEPQAAADGLAAVAYVKKHASEWDVSPDRVGIIGFSAGGAVTSEVAFHYTPESRPAFVAPIYAGGMAVNDAQVPADAPPMFVAAATDDSASASRPSASPSITSGLPPKSPQSCISTPRAATALACASKTCPPTTGSTASPTGSISRAF